MRDREIALVMPLARGAERAERAGRQTHVGGVAPLRDLVVVA